MKLYTAKFDAERPSTKCVQAPLGSSFGIGIEVAYGGRAVPLTPQDMTLDGSGPDDVVGGEMAVFKASTPSAPGRAAHDVRLGFDSDIVWAEFKTEGTGNRVNISADVPQFDGATFYAPGVQPDLSSAFDTPFVVAAYKEDGTSPTTGYPLVYVYSHDLLYPEADPTWGTPVLYVQTKKVTGTTTFRSYWYVPNATYTGWVSLEPGAAVTLPSNCYVYATANMAASVVRHSMDTKWTQRIQRQFGLFVDAVDKGVIEGYGDEYVFKNTADLSGTYADGTGFSFNVPIVEE